MCVKAFHLLIYFNIAPLAPTANASSRLRELLTSQQSSVYAPQLGGERPAAVLKGDALHINGSMPKTSVFVNDFW